MATVRTTQNYAEVLHTLLQDGDENKVRVTQAYAEVLHSEDEAAAPPSGSNAPIVIIVT